MRPGIGGIGGPTISKRPPPAWNSDGRGGIGGPGCLTLFVLGFRLSLFAIAISFDSRPSVNVGSVTLKLMHLRRWWCGWSSISSRCASVAYHRRGRRDLPRIGQARHLWDMILPGRIGWQPWFRQFGQWNQQFLRDRRDRCLVYQHVRSLDRVNDGTQCRG